MKLRLICYDGTRYELPEAELWHFQYGTGAPCDSFELRCPWDGAPDPALSRAVRFEAVWEGETVFRGVVDEFECRWDRAGGSLLTAGRGMAALLLDNEAECADYQVATLDDILRRHVEPYGIQTAERQPLPAVPGFSVESGSSEWQVLHDFARYHGGIAPRFDREGRLLLTGWTDGKYLLIDEQAAVLELSYRETRYGVLSEVLVRDRARQTVQRVENKSFIAQGGRCRRVFSMPGKSSYQAMRYSGQFQLEQSAAARVRVELTLPEPFAAWPGDLVELRRANPSWNGTWRVLATETGAGKAGTYTKMTLGER